MLDMTQNNEHTEELEQVLLRTQELIMSRYEVGGQPAEVTFEHICLVNDCHIQAADEACDGDFLSTYDYQGLEPEIAQETLLRLDSNYRTNPMGIETTRTIIAVIDAIYYENIIMDIAEDECQEFWEFLNRGNARATQGRPYEALEDYNKAIELAPQEAILWEARAILFRELGMAELAEKDQKAAEELKKLTGNSTTP